MDRACDSVRKEEGRTEGGRREGEIEKGRSEGGLTGMLTSRNI